MKTMAKKILIVDHSELMTEVMSYILSGKGYDVIALNGPDHIFTNIRQNHPDLVIIDSLLPGIDGADLCRLLKRNKATKTLPVIICTDSEDLDQSLTQKGAPDDILHKPFGMNNLIEKVEYQLAA
ncbi:response regulator [Mucilaginibacter aquaedulcis]|jgi:DNA-binding response OmpR family regulator|uniref:response regulator n=1 Tax=Mucilaginibacter aquaedulcis TaxID=1187081 RepID=UPI0025B59AD4|nr:response regulator [Mucilaginibacter aquaedulcis]MDN3550794.1 response regulator [Mucilaginibacter aquaedulcis]